MKVSQFMALQGHREKKKGRHRASYRAVRRNIAKIAYRRAKRGRA